MECQESELARDLAGQNTNDQIYQTLKNHHHKINPNDLLLFWRILQSQTIETQTKLLLLDILSRLVAKESQAQALWNQDILHILQPFLSQTKSVELAERAIYLLAVLMMHKQYYQMEVVIRECGSQILQCGSSRISPTTRKNIVWIASNFLWVIADQTIDKFRPYLTLIYQAFYENAEDSFDFLTNALYGITRTCSPVLMELVYRWFDLSRLLQMTTRSCMSLIALDNVIWIFGFLFTGSEELCQKCIDVGVLAFLERHSEHQNRLIRKSVFQTASRIALNPFGHSKILSSSILLPRAVEDVFLFQNHTAFQAGYMLLVLAQPELMIPIWNSVADRYMLAIIHTWSRFPTKHILQLAQKIPNCLQQPHHYHAFLQHHGLESLHQIYSNPRQGEEERTFARTIYQQIRDLREQSTQMRSSSPLSSLSPLSLSAQSHPSVDVQK